MRVVADTNIVVSGLLWHGMPRRVLETAREGRIELATSIELLAELQEVLERPRLNDRLRLAGVTVNELVSGFATLAQVVTPRSIPPVVQDDPDDDAVLACALGASAEIIVSGDSHLLSLSKYETLRIVSARQLLAELGVL